MGFFAPEMEILRLPAWDCLPYDRIGPSAGVSAERMATLTRLARGGFGKKPVLLVTQSPALLQRAAAAGRGAGGRLLRPGRRTTSIWPMLERYFAVNGYHRASTVSERGEFAIRGGVIDVFPPGADEPVRLDLFGDTLESIRAFDRETQRSTRQLNAVDLLPVSEALLDADAIARFRKGYVAAFGAPGDDPLYAAVSEGAAPGRARALAAAVLRPQLETLFDYLPADALIGARPPGRRGARRAAGDDRRRLRRARQTPSARRTTGRCRPSALYLDRRGMGRRARRASGAPVHAVPAGGRRPASSTSAPSSGRNFAAERAQDSVNLFEAAADHARRLIGDGQAGAVRLLVGGLVRAAGRDAGRPRPEGRPLRALLAGGQGGRSEEAAAGGAAARRRLRDRQPGGHLRDRHPGRPAGAARAGAAARPTSWPRPPR